MADDDAIQAGVDATKKHFEISADDVGHGLAVRSEQIGFGGLGHVGKGEKGGVPASGSLLL